MVAVIVSAVLLLYHDAPVTVAGDLLWMVVLGVAGAVVFCWNYGCLSLYFSMDNDFVLFLAGVSGLVLYLVFSALTEMGTKFPWRR